MSLIKCSECGREISDKASTCPGCGAPLVAESSLIEAAPKKSRAGLFLGIGALIVVVIIVVAVNSGPATGGDLCAQSSAAAHYIAAEAGANPGGVVSVTDDLIARNVYPALGDKALGALGAVVSLELAAGKSPDEIADIAHAACERDSGTTGGH